ncbi:MAG TPA: peptidoglycan DD-metalloendopeptidase family protein [Syntrophobacteria bacterium]|nr:peptidoglycan DD-metalloendopeptidase family protein [Syntrophobacteria bacterium]
MMVLASMVLALVLALPATATGQERTQRVQRGIQATGEQSHEVQQQLEQGRSQVETMRRQERAIIEQLDRMELRLQESRENARKLKGEHDSVRREISERRSRLQELNRELDGLQSLLARRLEALYKFGRQAYLEFLVSARDMADLEHRWVYLRDVAEQDQQLLGRLQRQKAEVEELRGSLIQREGRLAQLVAEIDQEHQHIEEVRRHQVAMLQEVHNQEQTYQRYVQELMGLARELDAKILGLQQQQGYRSTEPRGPVQPGGFANQKGALRYPVRGEVVARFGVVQHQTLGAKIRRNGIDIATQPLSPVVAVYPGQVLYCGWIKGYGNVIIIDHGDKYYTLSAQLADISKRVGEGVEAGEVIGYAGYAPVDNQRGRVYFEIRHEGKALDPLAWLRAGAMGALSPGRG